MHCVRRVALRAACSSSRTIAVPRQQVAAIALQMAKANAQPVAAMAVSRFFSQTARAALQWDEPSADKVGAMEDSMAEKERIGPAGYSIFISNMTFDATETHLEEAFSKYGTILHSNIARDGRGLSRGFAFLTFQEKEAADRAVAEADNSFWHGRRINVAHRQNGPSSPKTQMSKNEPTRSLYIGNIPYEASDADLNELFRSLDGVTDVRVAVDRNTGWPRGFAHADFVDVASATKAFKFLGEKTLGGRTLRIDYSMPRSTYVKKDGEGESQL
ncbi:RNA-binding domain-containing protein [Xylaria sp. CBS 124048]|nr:RNA-binding domain-containing protein [Xylaria sp. CBS 124048]